MTVSKKKPAAVAIYKISPSAKDDLERIWQYGAERWGIAKADCYIMALHQRFSELAERPFLCAAVDDIRKGYRRSVHGRDSIFYRIEGDDVEIMSILGKQNLSEWL